MSRHLVLRAVLPLLLPVGLAAAVASCDGSRIEENRSWLRFDVGGGDGWQRYDGGDVARDTRSDALVDVGPGDTGGGFDIDIKLEDVSGPPCVDSRDCEGVFADLGACERAICQAPPGVCVRVPKADGASCDDVCVTDGTCESGACVGGVPRDCDDGVDCTVDDCDPDLGCAHSPNDILCDDDDVCTEDHCVADTGCTYSEIPFCRCETDADCDDIEPCTIDSCGDDNVCDHVPEPDGTACEDGDECTERDRCEGGVCTPGPNTCPTSEICDDGVDNDGDGLADCDDDECAGAIGCDAACDADIVATCDQVIRGDTSGDDDTWSAYGCAGWTESGPDRVVAFQHGRGGDVAAALLTPWGGADLDIFLLDASCDPGAGCLMAGNQSVVFEARAGAPYYLVVDGWDGEAGPFTLVIDCLGDSEGDCANGVDDDGDGHIDCDDADCVSSLACGERDCADGVDNDGDGQTDCADPDCGNALACEAGCEDATVIGCDVRIRGTTAGAENVYSGYGCSAWDESGPERVWALRPETDGKVVVSFETLDDGVDHDLFLLDGTCDPGAGCLDFGNESLAFDAVADVTYNIVLDGWGGQAGAFVLTVDCLGGTQEQDCGNGADDDGDGLVDCDDADCLGSADCTEKDCRDGIDGDGDGLVDCDDPDCEGDRACIESICTVDETIGCDALVRRTTFGDDDTYGGYGCTAWDESGNDHIFGFTSDVAGPVQVTLLYTDPGVDLDVFLLDATCDPGDGCVAADSETFAFVAEPGVEYFVVVDGWGGQAGPYTLAVDCLAGDREQQCNDGADNDGDGYADCADADCADALNCAVCEYDDGFEEDDSAAGATPAGGGATFEGLIAREGDPDWFRLNVCRGADVTAQVFYDEEEGDIAVSIHGADGASQLARAAGAGGSAVARWDSNVDGVVTVQVEPPAGGCTGYTLQLTVDASGCAQPLEDCANGVDDDGDRATDCADPDCAGAPQCLQCEDDGREDNDTAGTASRIDDVTVVGGLIAAPGDDDWYRFPLCPGGGLQVTSTYTNGGVALELWSSNGLVKLDESRFSGGTERVAVVGQPDDVLVRVVGASGFCTRYELVFDETCGALCSDPIYEPNDTRGQAYDVSPGGMLTSLRLGAGDEDWFSLRVNNCDSPVVTALADWDPLDGDVNLELYDQSGALLQAADSPRGSSATVTVPASGGAWYTLRVWGQGNICMPYALSFVGQCPPACGQMDLYEPNDTRSQAWGNGSTGLFTSLALSPRDEDWFWYTTCADGVAVVTATTTTGEGDLDLELYDQSGNLLDVSEGTTEVESVAAVTPYSGRVYARVFGARPAETCLRYELALDRDCTDVCTDDIYEQNDTASQATDAAAGGYYSSLRMTTNDDDWFQVHVCAGGTLTVTSAYDPEGGEVDLELYDKTGTRKLDGAYGVTGSESITWQSPNADTLLVRAFGPGSVCTSYDLRIETGACGGVIIGPGETCGADPYEEDDRPEAATNAGTGGAYQTLSAEPNDPDWFRVRVCAGGTLTSTATWDGAAAGAVDLAVFAEDGATQLGSGQGAGGRASASTTSQGEATLLVRATLRGAECLPYRMDLLVAGCGGGDACGPDAFEDDDRRESANAAATGGSWPSLTGQAGDPDWFAVDLCPAGTVTATARALGEGDPVGLRLVRSNGTTALDSDSGAGGTATVTASPGDESQVYVVAEGAGRCRPYALDIERTGCGGAGCASDAHEPNDDAAAATDVGSGANLAGLTAEPGSPDWYAVQVCAGGALVATSTHTPQQGDIDVFLYASDGGTLLDSSQGLAGTEQVTFTSPGEPTTVYVQVRGIAGDCVPYTLDLVVDGCGGGACFDDTREDDDAPWEASEAGAGASFSDATAAPGDADWYAVQVCEGGFVYATAMVNPADGDIGLRLYDGDGATVVDSGEASSGTAAVTGGAAVAGTMYVRVLSVGDACVPYVVDIEVDGCDDQCTDDGREQNDSAATATDAGDGATFGDLVALGGDADWFRVLACADGTAEATVTWDPADGDVQLQLYRADGQLVLANGQGGAGSLTASARLPAGETIAFARVEAAAADGCVPYDITLATSGCANQCSDDALEENDVAGAATDLGGPTSVGGLRAVGGDADWFSVPTCRGGTLTTTVTFDAGAGDINVYLYAEDRTTELDSSTGAGGSETVSVTTSLETRFYVKVLAAGNACATYRIEATVEGCNAGCAEDDAEDDDSPAQAASYPEGGTLERTAVRGDRDWFAVPLCGGGNVRLRATFDASSADIDMRLYGADGSTVLDVSSGASGQETVEYTAASATTVYAEVYVSAGSCAPYSLEITIENCALGCTDDGAEPDDAVASAREVQPGTTLQDRVLAQNDPDWIAVEVCAGGRLDVSVSYTGEDGQLGIDLYDRDGFTLLGTTGGADGSAAIGATLQSGGARYVRVFGNGAVCIPYELTVTVTGCAACDDDDLEPDDGPAVATSAPGGGAFEGLVARPLDADWFSVPVCAGGRLTATLTYDPAAGDVGLRIYGSDGVTPVATSASGDGAENASYQNPLGASTLYVRVLEQSDEGSGACASYDLQLVVTGCGGGCQDDAQEENDGPGQAVDLGDSGEELPGLVAASGDADWFRVTVCDGGSLSAAANYAAADGTLGLAIFDRTGAALLTSDASGGGSALVQQENTTGAPVQWHVSAYALGDACMDYDLTVAVAGCGAACTDDELEDNDTAGSATPVPSGGLTRSLVADDADWFRVDVCAGGTVRANVDFEPEASTLDLRVYAADGTTALASDAGSDGALLAEAGTSQAGTLYVRVRDEDVGCTPYSVQISVSGCGSCPDDAHEDDDEAAQANPAGVGSVSGHIAAPGDPDWYAVTVCPGGALTVEAVWDGTNGDIDLGLFDRDGATALTSVNGVDGIADISASNPHAEEATIYLRVSGVGANCLPYLLDFSLEGCAAACDADELEENDGPELATPAGTGGEGGGSESWDTLSLSPDDADWYEVPVCAGGTLVADALFLHADGNLNLRLYASDGFSILASSTSWDDDEHLVWNAPAAAVTTYLRAYVTTAGACVFYDLDIDVLCD